MPVALLLIVLLLVRAVAASEVVVWVWAVVAIAWVVGDVRMRLGSGRGCLGSCVRVSDLADSAAGARSLLIVGVEVEGTADDGSVSTQVGQNWSSGSHIDNTHFIRGDRGDSAAGWVLGGVGLAPLVDLLKRVVLSGDLGAVSAESSKHIDADVVLGFGIQV